MRKETVVILLIAAGCATWGGRDERPASLSATQRAAMQTKELHGDFDTAFAATISVLQDAGWQVAEVEKGSGIIQASSLKRRDVIGPEDDWRAARGDSDIKELWEHSNKAAKKGQSILMWTRWDQLTVHVEPWGGESVRERVAIIKCGSKPSSTHTYKERGLLGFGSKQEIVTEPAQEQSVVIEDAGVYQRLFQQIQKAIFVRQGLAGGSGK